MSTTRKQKNAKAQDVKTDQVCGTTAPIIAADNVTNALPAANTLEEIEAALVSRV